VVFESPDGLKVIHARIVIAADGANSRVRKALGVKRNTDKHLGIAIRAYAKHQPYQGDENKLIFDFSEKLLPAYAWLFPITKTSSNVGLGMIVSEHKKRHAKLDELLTTFAQEFASFGYEIPEISNSRTYLLPHGARRPKLVHDRVVLIGDAGSMVNPLSGEGIFYGMCAGEMLGRMVSPMMGDQIDLTLRAFETEFRKRFAWHFRSNYVASILMRSTLWAKIVVKAAAKDPVVVRDAVELLFGEGTIRPSTTFRILRYGVH
jgi:flavin-dependent dehydrogenase